MSEQSKIQWTDSTGGPWLVCSEVSPGCAHCYARDLAETRLAPIIRKSYRAAGFADWETRPVWGDKAPRVLSKGFWNDIVTFNNKPWVCEHGRAFASQTDCQHESLRLPGQACQCHRRRCFPSLIDWLDEMPAGILDQDGNLHDPILVLGRFLNVLCVAGQVTWILCTKRPQNFFPLLEKVLLVTHDNDPLFKFVESWLQGFAPRNVVLLTTVENQEQEPRMDDLRKIPAACRGISFEPLLSAIKVRDWKGISWAIIGGESGSDARPCDVDWIRSLVNQTALNGVDVFVKQLGANPGFIYTASDSAVPEFHTITLRDKKGGDMAEWPANLDLKYQAWPKGF